MTEWMCDLCFPHAVEIGMIAPGYALILNDGKYQILGVQGHKGHEIYTFPDKPFCDPDPDVEHNEGPIAEAEVRWIELMDRIDEEFELDPQTGYHFVNQCQPEYQVGCFTTWLLNKCGKLIEAYENK